MFCLLATTNPTYCTLRARTKSPKRVLVAIRFLCFLCSGPKAPSRSSPPRQTRDSSSPAQTPLACSAKEIMVRNRTNPPPLDVAGPGSRAGAHATAASPRYQARRTSPGYHKLFDESKFVVSFFGFCVLVYMRTAHVLFVMSGACLVALSAKCLKLWLRKPRPRLDPVRSRDYGMPSSQAAVMVYFAVYIDLTAAAASPLYGSTFASAMGYPSPTLADQASPGSPSSPSSSFVYVPSYDTQFFPKIRPALLLLSVFLHCFVFYVLRTRVILRRHSTAQILAGVLLGAIFGACWFVAWHRHVWPCFRAWEGRQLYGAWSNLLIHSGRMPEILSQNGARQAGMALRRCWA